MTWTAWETRDGYQTTRLQEWTYDEVYDWLWSEGVWACGDEGHALTPEEARVEVALQAEAIGVDVPGANEIRDEWNNRPPIEI